MSTSPERPPCWCEGFRAGEAGEDIGACPYSQGTPEWYEWCDGWAEATDDEII